MMYSMTLCWLPNILCNNYCLMKKTKPNTQARGLQFRIGLSGFSKEVLSQPSSVKDKGDGKSVILYIINVTSPIQAWKVKHRYNDFYNLHELLSLHYISLPKLPPKTFLAVSSSSKIERRRKELEEYLIELLDYPNIMFDVYFSQFLNTNQLFPDYLCVMPKILCKYEASKSLTFTDLHYMKGRDLNYVICSKDIKRPQQQYIKFRDESPNSSVACESMPHKSILNGFKFDSSEPVNIFQDKKVVKTFDLKAHCLQYFPEAAMIAAGFSNGIIAVYKEERKPKIDDEYLLVNISKFKAMPDRVTKIMINSSRGEMYALGQGNRLTIIDMAYWTIKGIFKIGNSLVLAIHIDEVYNLGVSTSPVGHMLVLDFSKDKPEFKKQLTIANEPVELMDCDIESGRIILATGKTGLILLVDIQFPFSCVN